MLQELFPYNGSENNSSTISCSSMQDSDNRTLLSYDNDSLGPKYVNSALPELQLQESRNRLSQARYNFLVESSLLASSKNLAPQRGRENHHDSNRASHRDHHSHRDSRRQWLRDSKINVDEWLNKQPAVISSGSDIEMQALPFSNSSDDNGNEDSTCLLLQKSFDASL